MNPENPDGGAEEGSMNQVSLACGPCWVGSRAGRLDLEAVSAENTHLGLKQDSPTPPAPGWESTPGARGRSSLGSVTGLSNF